MVDYALDYFRKRPDADMVSLDCSDGRGQCECEECAKLGTISDRVFGLANEAAKAVAKEYPGKMVGLYAYAEHSEPPHFKLEPNVYIQLTHGFIRGQYTFDELTTLWPQYCNSMGYYDYYSVYLWDWDMPPGGRAANVDYVASSIRRYVNNGATTLSCESGNNWGLHGRGYYLASCLMWNPEADEEAILQDFYQQAFGPAAAAIQRYYERLDPGGKPLMSEQLIGAALRDLEEAARLAADRPDILARLRHLQQYMHYVSLRWQLTHTRDKAEQKELALAILTHVYRTRYSYMNHWEALRQSQTRKWAETYEEPTWAFNEATKPKPWAVEKPVTPEETAAAFAADLARFQPMEVTEVAFSEQLVPAGFTSASPAPTSQRYQGNGTYLLYSPGGEPLAWTVTVGTIAWYRDRAPGSLTLSTADGTTVHEAVLPLDGEPKPFVVPVPAPGLYRLMIRESGAAFAIEVPAGAPCVLPLERGRRYLHSGHMQPLWFYVPKGTTNLEYFIVNSSSHELFGPDGKELFQGEKSGVYYRVPVPPGMDGQLWGIRKIALGQLWFFNAPNYLAASPDAMLLPKELTAPTE